MTDHPMSRKRRKPDLSKSEQAPEELRHSELDPARLDAIGRVAAPRVQMEQRDPVDDLEGRLLDVLIDDPVRRPWLQGGLPWKTRIVLAATRRLKVAMPPDDIRKLREDLRAARASLDELFKISGRKADPLPDSVEKWLEGYTQEGLGSGAYREVDSELARYAAIVRSYETLLDGTGYRWNWSTRVMESSPGAVGGRPRQLLRNLVRSLLLAYGDNENTVVVRERIASSLAPFFSAGVLDPSKGSPLYNAVDHAISKKKT